MFLLKIFENITLSSYFYPVNLWYIECNITCFDFLQLCSRFHFRQCQRDGPSLSSCLPLWNYGWCSCFGCSRKYASATIISSWYPNSGKCSQLGWVYLSFVMYHEFPIVSCVDIIFNSFVLFCKFYKGNLPTAIVSAIMVNPPFDSSTDPQKGIAYSMFYTRSYNTYIRLFHS